MIYHFSWAQSSTWGSRRARKQGIEVTYLGKFTVALSQGLDRLRESVRRALTRRRNLARSGKGSVGTLLERRSTRQNLPGLHTTSIVLRPINRLPFLSELFPPPPTIRPSPPKTCDDIVALTTRNGPSRQSTLQCDRPLPVEIVSTKHKTSHFAHISTMARTKQTARKSTSGKYQLNLSF
jgi:hypothetical protein